MKSLCLVSLITAGIAAAFANPAGAPQDASTPAELVAAYNSLADAILAAKKTEHDLVMAILAGTYRHAEGRMQEALAKRRAGEPAGAAIEAVAALVAQLGNEGDNSVAAVRKRLIEGGHHHNAAGEQKGIYDEGFVIVTRAAKKAFLDSATAIAKLGANADENALNAEWAKVSSTYSQLKGK